MGITQQEEVGLLSLAQQDAAILPSTDLDQDTEYPDELHKPAPSLPSDQRLNNTVCSLLSRSQSPLVQEETKDTGSVQPVRKLTLIPRESWLGRPQPTKAI